MTETIRAKIGFVSSGTGSSPHYASFTPLIPEDVRVDFEGLNLHEESLYEVAGKKHLIVSRVKDLVKEHSWQGVLVSAAPLEVLNPGLLVDLRAALSVPVTTALDACVAALKAFSAKRVLLLTPFEERMNRMICDYLGEAGIVAVAPHPFRHLGDALKLNPDEIFELTSRALKEVESVEAVYFQGAVLDPLKVLQRIEKDLRRTAVASNPAMLWFILRKLNLTYRIRGYGRLVDEWPALPL
ncbi:MAG: hypothetical protein HY695_05565 [Deltaproteobacteria bacterium]|nr:hypothetical protein [Deltaproteobacteria bacterium]